MTQGISAYRLLLKFRGNPRKVHPTSGKGVPFGLQGRNALSPSRTESSLISLRSIHAGTEIRDRTQKKQGFLREL